VPTDTPATPEHIAEGFPRPQIIHARLEPEADWTGCGKPRHDQPKRATIRTPSRRNFLGAAAAALLAAAGGTAGLQPAAAAAGPAATLEAFYGTLLGVMKKGKQESFRQRYADLTPAIERTLDLPFMTRIAVGPKWATLSSDERQKLVSAFERYTIATYASNFDDYSGERFEVSPRPLSNPNGVIVDTRIIKSDGEPRTLNYLMHQTGDGWQVIDVYLDGTISQLAVRRSEFSGVVERSGADGLVRVLDQKAAALGTG
jgi:phospholipid transport system substrate-binding protein